MIESLFADIRFALRWLRKSPAFTLVAVASLAIGIGFNTALFTIVDALLFKPLPVWRPDRLVDVFTSASASRGARFSTSSYPDYLDLRSRNDVFEDIVGYTPMFGALAVESGSRLAMGEIVSGNYFRVLGVPAFAGRVLLPEDDTSAAARVAMVSYRYWTRELGATPDLNGKTLRLRGQPFTIVGVTPPSFTGMVPVLSPEIWIPVAASLDVEPVGMHDVLPSPTGANRLERRGDRWMFMRGRLKPGLTADDAGANLALIATRLAAEYPTTNKDRQVSVRPTSEVHFHPAADPQILPIAGGLMVVVGLVLVIACLNVASMLLARASGRQREIGVRLAIGAGRGRLIRQLVTETVVLSLLGAVAALVLASWLTTIVGAINLPSPIPFAFNLRIDLRVLIFTLTATFAAALVAGLAPAILASKPNLVAELRGEQKTGSAGGHRWTLGDLLVAGQMAITAVLLVVAALLTRSVLAAQRANLGFPVDRIALVSIDASQLRYSKEQVEQFYDAVLARIRGISGVEAVGLATRPPFSVNYNRWEIWIPALHQPGQHGTVVDVTNVSADYFKAMDVPIVLGRTFTDDDRPETPRVAIVNETMARTFWPNQNAVGQTFRSRNSEGPLFQIVGVSADHKVTTVGEGPTPFLHVSRRQQPNPYTAVIARTRGDASALLRDMRREIHGVEPTLAFVENQTMEDEVGMTLFPMRASAWLVSAIGIVAMLLAAVGLYGVIAYSVARRTREIGIRMALGAQSSTVVGSVMRQGLVIAALGLVAGVTVTILSMYAASVFMPELSDGLYGIRVSDPASWFSAAAVLLAVSALANLFPAWRAARVHPSEALRTE
ncbi:MAG TPA: ABC transporter permease [Vicinamibacterales bacterium]|nr:ABC transporter permease [Vicinamibacterales bacterium]